MPAPRFAPAAVDVERRPDGSLVLRCPLPLAPHEPSLGAMLERWAREAPSRPFLAERAADGTRREVSYAEALSSARSIGEALLGMGLGPSRPLLLLSDNSVDHALMQLGAMHAGVPAAPVSPAYSLQSADHAKLRQIAEQVGAGAVFASREGPFSRALDALGRAAPLVVSEADAAGRHVATVAELRKRPAGEALERARAAVGPDSVAKILFTSGSTGAPKGVVNTHRMLCSNQQAIAQLWPFLEEAPPVVVDWLPWSHTFGGNHNFNMVLRNGGTLHVDAGKPAPGLIERTVESLREISPTLYFNVPRGFDALLPFLEADQALRESFFRRLDVVFYAAAALPQHLWRRLEAVAARARREPLAMVSAWGSTETSPLVTQVHFPIDRAGVIGLPAPGCELKLAPVEGRLEMRVKGPNVTPGYWRPGGQITPITLDDQGFLPTGDAGKLEDPAVPSRGVVFDGRIAENFKLSSGTWVAVGELRVGLLAHAPLAQDAAVAGHDRDFVSLLVFPNLAACREIAGSPSLSPGELCAHPAVRERLRDGISRWNQSHPQSSRLIRRALLLAEPPSIDGGEITDKGYLNQRAVLARRASLVDRLYAEPPAEEVLVIR